MKKLLFIFLIIFSSQPFAKSVVGKVLFCENEQSFEHSYGFVFIDEENVEKFSFNYGEDQKIDSFRNQYNTSLRNISIIIYESKSQHISMDIDRKTLIGEFIVRTKDRIFPPSIYKCSVQNSKEELVNLMRKGIQKILNNNQL